MKVFLYTFGKIKTPGLQEASDHYLKLLRPWIPLEVRELKSQSSHDGQKRETELLEKALKQHHRCVVYLLDETGEEKSTLAWSETFQTWQSSGISEICFCIGSSWGFSPSFKKKKDCMSLGKQTLAYSLCRIVLLEQIYRIQTLLHQHPYHHL
jgi:23S rRNA (pseudouridine1915-N3)-methyltransferase